MAKQVEEKKPSNPKVDSDSDSSDDEDYVPDGKFQENFSDIEEDSDDSDTEQYSNDYNGEYDFTSSSRSGKRRGAGTSEDNKKHVLDDPISQAEALRKKSRIDALWADLNTPISKPNSRPDLLAAAAVSSSSLSIGSNSKPELSSSTRMVTITTTYDFAGETVTVTKDVPENSKEAKEYARKNKGIDSSQATLDQTEMSISDKTPSSTSTTKKQLSITTDDSTSSTSTSLGVKTSDTTIESSTLDSIGQKPRPVRYVRRKSTLDELAATYGVKKPPKMNTLEKSKLDWNNFVGKEGIEDELKHHNKDGYMEKVAFLQRTDERRDQEYQMMKKRR
ncbi:Craniofacial development protein 1 [Haplosporangium sp. Z 27]|nr:Craniofacial development protein 1 [Haplosporangium sp. Z 27]